jgi:hypothetical protein
MANAKDTATTAPAEDEFYDEANEEFPGKEDLKDRLVAVWVTGKTGKRVSADGKPYPYVETVTLVLDDGPEWTGKRQDGTPNLVGTAPAQLDNFQWSTEGMVARLTPRINAKHAESGEPNYRPMVGRINSRKNKVKGYSDSWSIAAPSEDDKALLRTPEVKAQLARITAEVTKLRAETEDQAAFDE